MVRIIQFAFNYQNHEIYHSILFMFSSGNVVVICFQLSESRDLPQFISGKLNIHYGCDLLSIIRITRFTTVFVGDNIGVTVL
ncbi:hypothetical protein EDD80_112120 [Anseongella ginsenosidimutans]|uniref:Uncharacterized protein n=1 Tax=Anseongella ginsenosidimutans TaxID=496056 RepID=A0A4R3KMK2_9SPHI|nr:hypothetical protein EDD80_112120 [Anseongella ginsenosidimutans]